MFFFFVGGINQQVRQVLKSGAGKCINCGSSADLVEYDKVFKAFFIPVWKWPAKDPLMHCNDCNLFFPPLYASKPPPSTSVVSDDFRCRSCDRFVDSSFRFCPFCGSSL